MLPPILRPVWFVPLAPFADPELVPATIVQVLGIRLVGSPSILDQLLAFLRDDERLIVLDNFEHLLAAAPVVSDLLIACRHLKVLVTSRAVLHLSGEHTMVVEPLTLPPANARTADRMAASSAIQLFVTRAVATTRRFALTDDNAADIAAICRRLDGLPLAIELAAARCAILPLSALLDRLDRRLPLLTGGPRDQPDRLQTMRAAIAWSYDLLSAPEQMLFRRLAVFAGSGTLDAIEAVCNVDRAFDGELLDLVSSLADKSLLFPFDRGGHRRFGMLETIREFSGRLFDQDGDRSVIWRALVDHLLDLARRAAPVAPGREQAEWLDRVEAEHANLRAALGWLDETGDVAGYRALTDALWLFWWVRGHYDEAWRRLERSLELGAGIRDAMTAKAWLGTGWVAHTRGSSEAARPRFLASLSVARSLNDPAAAALALLGVGATFIQEGNPEAALPYLEENLALERSRGDPARIALGLTNLSDVELLLDRFDRAEALLSEALALRATLPPDWVLAMSNIALARIRLEYDDVRAASTFALAGIRAAQAVGSPGQIGAALESVALIALVAGDPTRAAAQLGASGAYRAGHGLHYSTWERAKRERALARLEATLGHAIAEAHRRLGKRGRAKRQSTKQPASSPPCSPSRRRRRRRRNTPEG